MNIVQFEVFGRASKPDASTAGQVCKTWVSKHAGVNPYNARVAVNVDNSGIWSDDNVRQHYGLLHYGGQTCTWDFVSVNGQKYLLLVVSDAPPALAGHTIESRLQGQATTKKRWWEFWK